MLLVCCTILHINSYNTKFIWETKRKWIVWIVRETLCVNEKENWIGIFYDKPGKQNQEKKLNRVKKKKKNEPYRL